MPSDPKPKKTSPPVNESQSDTVPPDPDAFLAQLDDWGNKPNPASFEKLLEAYHDKFARAFAQGYTVDDICRLAASNGIQVKPSTFRKYWHKLNAKLSNNTSTTATEPTTTSLELGTKSKTKPDSTAKNKPDSTASTNSNSAVNF